MDAIELIKKSLAMSEMVSMSYLGDLTDDELMQRPHAECNHLNWQVGHLVASENQMVQALNGTEMPALPDGFAEKYGKETNKSDDASQFATKEELMAAYKQQRAGTLECLSKFSEADLDTETGIDYAPTAGDMFSLLGAHWLMHCGQWVVIRRENGKPVVI